MLREQEEKTHTITVYTLLHCSKLETDKMGFGIHNQAGCTYRNTGLNSGVLIASGGFVVPNQQFIHQLHLLSWCHVKEAKLILDYTV